MIDTTSEFGNFIYHNYNNFRLNQYHLKIDGLYKEGNEYYILIPELTDATKAIDGENIHQWFQRSMVIGGGRINLTSTVNDDAEKVDDLSNKDIGNLAGSLMTAIQLNNVLLHSLPRDFPEFKLVSSGIIQTEKELSDDQIELLTDTLRKLKLGIKLKLKTGSLKEVVGAIDKKSIAEPDVTIWNSKSFGGLKNSPHKVLWERDEDFWSDNKMGLLDNSISKNEFLGEGWNLNQSSCFVSDSLEPDNIRTYLSLFQTVYLNLPLYTNNEQYFQSLGITHKELLELVRMKRVKLVLPQPLQRYRPDLLNILLNVEPSDYLLSRKLACVTVADSRDRNPILYPTISFEDRAALLHAFYSVLSSHDLTKKAAPLLVEAFSKMWGNYFENISYMGANGLTAFGMYNLVKPLLEKQTGKDFSLEVLDAAPSVNFSAALNATVIPTVWDGYNSEQMCSIVANFHSGIPSDLTTTNWPYSNTSVDDIFVIHKDVPVIELANAFNGGDTDRFREFIFDLTKHKKNEEELQEALKLHNQYVEQFDRSNKRTKSIGLHGLIISGANVATGGHLPAAAWLVERLNQILLKVGVKNGTIQKFMDELASNRTGGNLPSAVLVARMQQQLKDAHFNSRKKR